MMADAINRATVADQAYAALKSRIIEGTLPAGSRLLPQQVAADLMISPTPVKEALLRLERDGLIATESRRGAVVRRFAQSDMAELYEAREVIEAHAIRVGFAEGRITPDFVAGLETEHATLGLAADRAFHARIAALCGNKLLAELHAKVMTQTHTVRTYANASQVAELLRAEHGAIVDAFRDGRKKAALRALKRHLRRSCRDLLNTVTP